ILPNATLLSPDFLRAICVSPGIRVEQRYWIRILQIKRQTCQVLSFMDTISNHSWKRIYDKVSARNSFLLY
ncbi:MAG TPA: hypothetical protein VGA72_04345, partial [Anaerolineales bacterium]